MCWSLERVLAGEVELSGARSLQQVAERPRSLVGNAAVRFLWALGRTDEMVLAEKAPRSHPGAKNELPALEAGHHGFGARRGDDGAWGLLDVAQAILRELGVGHAAFYPDAI